jgi:hypothetical protein
MKTVSIYGMMIVTLFSSSFSYSVSVKTFGYDMLITSTIGFITAATIAYASSFSIYTKPLCNSSPPAAQDTDGPVRDSSSFVAGIIVGTVCAYVLSKQYCGTPEQKMLRHVRIICAIVSAIVGSYIGTQDN